MKARHIVVAAAFLAIGGAQAQLLDAPADTATPRLSADAGRPGPLAAGFTKSSPLYGGNETANPNDRQFPGFRTDHSLVLGYAFNQYLALETGYSHLRDKGFHKIDTFEPEERAAEAAVAAGALGARSHTTYVAAKLTLPLTDRLTTYGKLGIAHSEVRNDGLLAPQRVRPNRPSEFVSESGRGGYGAIGAKYKLNDRTTLSGEAVSNASARQFGKASNASGVKGSVGIGF